MVIKHRSFNHKGGYYFYRVHNIKTNKLCNDNFYPLKTFLDKVYNTCPDKYFNDGPRGSGLKLNFGFDKIRIKGHEVSKLTSLGLDENKERYKTSHSKVQVFMLENDGHTIAVEVPIWIKPNELDGFSKFFNSDHPLTGHIDILRIEDDKIWVWDYKPNAKYEKYADTQVYFYALMLSKRTGIPLKSFRCGYFDEDYAFMFKPEEKQKRLF